MNADISGLIENSHDRQNFIINKPKLLKLWEIIIKWGQSQIELILQKTVSCFYDQNSTHIALWVGLFKHSPHMYCDSNFWSS